jgi:adenylate kinase
MIVVVTGMVGLNKKSYLEEVCRLARQDGHPITLCNVGDMMYAEAPDIPPGKILDIPLKRLHSLRRSVFKDILIEARRAPNLIVNTHATFRWRHGLFPAVDFDQMRQLNADMYVCLIDGVAAMHLRLCRITPWAHLKDLSLAEEEIALRCPARASTTRSPSSAWPGAAGREPRRLSTGSSFKGSSREHTWASP